MKHLHIDIETYSPEPIAAAGVYRYAEHPDFDILLVGYKRDDDETRCIELAAGEPFPGWLAEALADPSVVKHAHNAVFERVCFTHYFRRRGWLAEDAWLDPAQWRCSMVQCARCGLPLSLDQAGAALGLEEQKMAEGRALIKLFCVPQPKSAGLFPGRGRVTPADQRDKWATFVEYCRRDVDVECEISRRTEWYEPGDFEDRLYALDQKINDRGALVDRALVRKAIALDAKYKARLNAEAMKLTGLDNPNSVQQLKAWITDQSGVEVNSLNRKDLSDISDLVGDRRVTRMLKLRSEMSKTSTKKYEAMRQVVGSDGRVRGLMQFYGSRTGRWAGRLVQVQNLPQNHIKDLDLARRALLDGDGELLELCYGNVPDVLSQLIRTAFIAPEGKTLAVCDFSAIEARVIAWLAGEDWVLDIFRGGGDIYCSTASRMFSVPVEKHGRNAELRQKGKIAVLALGYGGGVGALDKMGGQRMGLSRTEEGEIVDRWREANPNIVRMWTAIEWTAVRCVLTGCVATTHGLTFRMEDRSTMTIQLPSGRRICYPEMTTCTNRFGDIGLKFMGLNQTTRKWEWVETYGGRLTENVVQAIARDCLAVALDRIEAAGIPIIFHVHDEAVTEIPEPGALETLKRIFAEPVPWAPGLPLSGAGYTGPYYFKD